MSTVLTGVAADPTTSPTATCPSDGDTGNAASVDGAFQALLNDISWLRTHIAQVDNTNTFTQAQTLQALLTLAAAGAVSLSRSGDQTILKSGTGKLQLGTSIATDLELQVGGVTKAILRAADGKMQGQSTAAGDGGTTLLSKDYLDTVATAAAAGSNWTLPINSVRKSGNVVSICVGSSASNASAGWSAVATLPAGYRPAVDISVIGRVYTSGVYRAATIAIVATGNVSVTYCDDGSTMSSSLPAIGTGDGLVLSASFVV